MDTKKLASDLETMISERSDIPIVSQDLLDKSNVNYKLDYLQGSNLYRLILRSQRDIRGFLYAVTRILDEKVDANVVTTKVDTRRNGEVYDIIFFRTAKHFEDVRVLLEQNFRSAS